MQHIGSCSALQLQQSMALPGRHQEDLRLCHAAGGMVDRQLVLSMDDLAKLPTITIACTLVRASAVLCQIRMLDRMAQCSWRHSMGASEQTTFS